MESRKNVVQVLPVAAGESAAAGNPTVTPVAICADGGVT